MKHRLATTPTLLFEPGRGNLQDAEKDSLDPSQVITAAPHVPEQYLVCGQLLTALENFPQVFYLHLLPVSLCHFTETSNDQKGTSLTSRLTLQTYLHLLSQP